MSSIRVSASGPGNLLGAALLPVPALDRAAFQSRGRVSGNPGTNRIPAESNNIPQDQTAQAQMGYHRTSDGPMWWLPSVYYSPDLDAPPNVSAFSDNQMPAPARDWLRIPQVVAGRPRIAGQKQVPAYKPAPKYLARS